MRRFSRGRHGWVLCLSVVVLAHAPWAYLRWAGPRGPSRSEAVRLRVNAEGRPRVLAALQEGVRREVARRRYAEAVEIVDVMLEVDPNSDFARGVRPLLLDQLQTGRPRATTPIP